MFIVFYSVLIVVSVVLVCLLIPFYQWGGAHDSSGIVRKWISYGFVSVITIILSLVGVIITFIPRLIPEEKYTFVQKILIWIALCALSPAVLITMGLIVIRAMS